jgi:hypothetical protein
MGPRVQPWRGFLLGYAQVPVEQMPALVRTLAQVVRARPQPRKGKSMSLSRAV